jgi:PAS domain S-box-containing protein
MKSETSHVLKESSQIILSRWEEEVRMTIPAAKAETSSALRNSIPYFLQDLINAMESNFSLQREDFLRFAHKHGKERANDSSYSIEDAITEFNILRKVIFDVLEDKCEITSRDRDIIYEAISLALAKAGAEFARTQMREVVAITKRLQLITNIQPTLIVYLDKEMNYLFANQTYFEWFKMKPEDIKGKNVREVFPKEMFEEFHSKFMEVFGGKTVRFKHFVNYPVGRKYVDVTYQPHLDEDGKVLGVFVSVDDRTDEKAKLDELRKEQELREKFVSTLSHDLRTPLTASKMSAQIIARKINDSSMHTHTTRIVDNINRADKLIQDLLDASKIRAGKMSLPETEEFDLIQLLRATLDDLTAIHGERFTLTGPRKLDVNLHQDGIRRILENLCSNAIKYGSTTEPVRVKVEPMGEQFRMSVCNSGNPLIHIDRDKLFEPFEQFHGSGKSGWGIGLTIVKGITEAHGGSVRVESDGNTTFTVNLPVNAAPQIENHLH